MMQDDSVYFGEPRKTWKHNKRYINVRLFGTQSPVFVNYVTSDFVLSYVLLFYDGGQTFKTLLAFWDKRLVSVGFLFH